MGVGVGVGTEFIKACGKYKGVPRQKLKVEKYIHQKTNKQKRALINNLFLTPAPGLRGKNKPNPTDRHKT